MNNICLVCGHAKEVHLCQTEKCRVVGCSCVLFAGKVSDFKSEATILGTPVSLLTERFKKLNQTA